MKNIAQKIISIGGQDVVMTRKGHPKLPEPFLFLVRSDLAGLIQEYQIVSSDEAARIIEKFPNAIYFMLTKESVFPLDLFTPDAQHAIGWKWYLGNPFLSRAKTGVVQDLQQLAIESAACRELIVQQ